MFCFVVLNSCEILIVEFDTYTRNIDPELFTCTQINDSHITSACLLLKNILGGDINWAFVRHLPEFSLWCLHENLWHYNAVIDVVVCCRVCGIIVQLSMWSYACSAAEWLQFCLLQAVLGCIMCCDAISSLLPYLALCVLVSEQHLTNPAFTDFIIRSHHCGKRKMWPTATDVGWSVYVSVGHNHELC